MLFLGYLLINALDRLAQIFPSAGIVRFSGLHLPVVAPQMPTQQLKIKEFGTI